MTGSGVAVHRPETVGDRSCAPWLRRRPWLQFRRRRGPFIMLICVSTLLFVWFADGTSTGEGTCADPQMVVDGE